MVHLHSFTLTNGAHEIVEAWGRGSRSGNVSWAITLYDETRQRDRDHYLEVNELQKQISELKQNIAGLQALLTKAEGRGFEG
jgi:hypothetical protein